MKSKINAIIFDLGGTLLEYVGLDLNWYDLYNKAFKYVSTSLALDLHREDIEAAKTVLKKYNPRINPREVEYHSDKVFSEVIETWKQSRYTANDIAKHFYRFFQKKIRVYPETPQVLRAIHNKGIKLGILSDLPVGMPDELMRDEVSAFNWPINCILTSQQVGFRKPHLEGYSRAAVELKCAPENCIFIGDEEKDVVGANKAGMVSVLLDRNGHNRNFGQRYTIVSLTELMSLI